MGGVESIDAVQPIVCLLAARLHGPGSPEGGGANVRITSRRRANASCGDVTVPIVTCETGWVAGEAYMVFVRFHQFNVLHAANMKPAQLRCHRSCGVP